MADIVERLRVAFVNGDPWATLDLANEAADEIETLRKELEAARAVLVQQAGIMHRFGDKPRGAE